jgi:hypothetical protein
MPGLRPSAEDLAAAVADSLVVSVDQGARDACIYYYFRAAPWIQVVVDGVRKSPDEQVRSLGERLLGSPADPSCYQSFKQALLAKRDDDPDTAELFEAAWQAECHSRLGYHLGSRYTDDGAPSVTADDLAGVSPVNRPAADPDAELAVVIPFRDRNPGRGRLRNLLASLLALGDQSYPRERYRLVVVESDERPRHRELIEGLVDTYLFAPNAGTFNKSWAVNVGVVNAADAAEAVCILDADVLTDGDFIARNAERFRRRGTAGHLTFRNMFCLSETASSSAIRQRLVQGAAMPDTETLRGFVMRRPPGATVWARTGTFQLIGGMDERFEGWGGEDNDFVYRMDINSAFDSYDDWLLHMHHPPSSYIDEDGGLPNDAIPALSWGPGQPIGRIDRFSAEAAGGPDLRAHGM